ncbi:MAG: cysteine--tRNA ligase [Promethearchaeota archaeon]
MKIYDTYSRKKIRFSPLDPPRVKMYVCGPTVYDSPHVGHARSAVAFDVIRRFLEYKGHDVIFTRNYTDIDDKMIARANEMGITIFQLARKYIEEYELVMNLLNVKPPVYAPRATHLIEDFIKFIKILEDKGFAYNVDGNVYFRINKYEKYGLLSKKPVKEINDTLQRNSDNSTFTKQDPRDFALWKKQKDGEPAWDSPWGKGRPGWHLECSVMSMKLLGKTIDIHGGGKDLIFPHHENEIAQSEAYSGQKFCRYWVHNGFVTIKNEKMSKSLGNFFTVLEILKEYKPQELRFFLISAHYRNPIDFSSELLDQARKNWGKIRDAWQSLTSAMSVDMQELKARNIDKIKLSEALRGIFREFEAAMDDDFNTPRAIASLFSLIRMINDKLSNGKDTQDFLEQAFVVLNNMLSILGFDDHYITLYSGYDRTGDKKIENAIQFLVDLRAEARKNNEWERADKIRGILQSSGIKIEDGKDKSTWTFN